MRTLKEIKSSMLVNVETSTITIEGNNLVVSASFLNQACIEGLYRQMSMELASGDTEANRAEIIARFGRGYLKASEEKKANQVTKIPGKKETQVSIERWEVRAWIADNMPERLEAFKQSNDKALALAMKAYYTPLLCDDNIIKHMPTTATYKAIVAIDTAKKQAIIDEAARIKDEEKVLVELVA